MNLKKLTSLLLKPYSSNKYTKDLFSVLYKVGLFGLYGDEWDFLRNGELRVMKMIANRHVEKAIIFDVGANEGTYCEHLLNVFNHQQVSLLVYGFEPATDTYGRYSDRFKNNPKVITNNVGLSDRTQILRLYKSKISSGFATLYKDNKFNFDASEDVAFTTLDEYSTTNKIDEIHFLKMDVEGHELAVLKGATNLLDARRIKAIQFEFGAGNMSARTFFKDFYDLLTANYRIFRIVKNGLVPVDKYAYNMEIFGRVTNYVAFLRPN